MDNIATAITIAVRVVSFTSIGWGLAVGLAVGSQVGLDWGLAVGFENWVGVGVRVCGVKTVDDGQIS